MNIIEYSNTGLSIILIPKSGKLDNTKGNKAQCMAQATDAVIPNASQLNLLFVLIISKSGEQR